MNFQQDFSMAFGDKYTNLQLKDVMVKRRDGVCTITFLYPSTVKEMADTEKTEIVEWLKSNLQLEKMELKVKFMRVFVEEKLILKALQTFFDKRYKLVTSYVTVDNFKIEITPIDVVVDIDLSPRMVNFFEEHKIANELSKFLKDNFLVDFTLKLNQNDQFVDDVDIENVAMKTTYRLPKRYTVEIVKDLVGFGITPKPEYLSFITGPKESVIVAGFIKKIERKDFIAKSGKHAGDQRTYFTFQIADGKGKLECIYFSSKRNVAVMEEVQECDFVLLHGDVKVNQLGKLCLYVDRASLATIPEKEEPDEVAEQKFVPTGKVVEIERLSSLEQDSMFEQKDRYNAKIMGKTIVVFDIETTGLDSENDQIIELGAVKIENGNIMEKFSTFVKPTKKIPYEVVNLTGITQEMVEDAPPVELVIKEFYDFTRGCTLCGHNIINFDLKFIKREGENQNLAFDNSIIDTLNEARTSRLKIARYNLGTVTKALGISLEGAHRAWNDAYATAQVLLKLNEV